MSRTSRAAKGFVTSVFQFTSQILVQVLLAPVVLKVAGRETLGAYAAIMQVVGFIALVDVVGSWSLERFLGQAVSLDDGGARFRGILTTARTVFLFCNVAFALLVVVFSLFIGHLLHLSPAVAAQARYALYVIAIWSIVHTPLAAYGNALLATQDLAAMNLIGTGAGLLRAIASLGFVLLGGGLFGLMLAGTAAEAIVIPLYRMRFKRTHPTLMPGWGFRDKALLKEMLSFSGHASFLNIGGRLIYQSGNFIAGSTSGAADASTYYTSQLPAMTIYNMMHRLAFSATPAINELWGLREVGKLRSALKRLTRLMLAMTLPLAVGTLLYNRDVVTVWVGANQYAGLLLSASVAGFCVVATLQRLAVDYCFTFGWMRLLSAVTLVEGIVNFGLAFFLARLFGLGGIMLALALVTVPPAVIFWYKIGRFLEIRVPALMGECFLRALVPLAAASFVSWEFVHRYMLVRKHDVWPLLAEVAAFMVVYAVLAYPLMLAQHDRDEIRRYGCSLVNRGRVAGQKLARLVTG